MSYYFNEHCDDPEEIDYEVIDQIEREEQWEKYCDDVEKLHENMMDYISTSFNPSLMEHSDYFDLMKICEDDKFDFTENEKKRYLLSHRSRSFDNCVIPDPIDLELFETFNLDTDDPPPYTSPASTPKPKKILKKKTPSPPPPSPKKKFNGWKKLNLQVTKIEDIQDIQKNSPKVKVSKSKARRTRRALRVKGKYIPPSLR
jgi:hypothetical protein